jgi:hypothetical protein
MVAPLEETAEALQGGAVIVCYEDVHGTSFLCTQDETWALGGIAG